LDPFENDYIVSPPPASETTVPMEWLGPP